MAYTVLARRYRSTTFDEVVGQEHVAQTLKKAIASGRIAHAYLFCGTRGTGKTSMARIMAKALNCESSDGPTTEPCGKCSSCLGVARGEDMDVIEIDAASNTGVDNVRDVIENSQYRPARSRFKIYIIDETHMLSKAAFNALLKTLEEPPEHVKFILATTEPEKILPTILSRCQRYDFRNIPTREIAGHLKEILKKEKIKADDDAILLVAKAGAGSMRDALSLLDRLLSLGEKNLTIEIIEQLLGLPRSQQIFDLGGAIGASDVKATLSFADTMITNGLSLDTLVASLVDHLRNLLILRTCGAESGLVEVPGIPMGDLVKQAGQFDPVALSQDITLLEEIRRSLRTSQAGRALLDATLVRLALADQFASIGELLGRVDGQGSTSSGAPVQKKKYEPIERAPVAAVSSQSFTAADPRPDPLPEGEGEEAVPEPVAVETSEADSDDDLPRPGKVWEGPSLAELLKQSTPAPVKPRASVAASPSNVEPIVPGEFKQVWANLVARLQTENPGLSGLLAHGRLVGIEDGKAIIQYGADHAFFAKMFDRNGKRETLQSELSKELRTDVGISIKVDTAVAEESSAAGPSATVDAPASRRESPSPRAAVSRPMESVMPPSNGIALTPELKATLAQDPLIRAIMDELGGQIVRVE